MSQHQLIAEVPSRSRENMIHRVYFTRQVSGRVHFSCTCEDWTLSRKHKGKKMHQRQGCIHIKDVVLRTLGTPGLAMLQMIQAQHDAEHRALVCNRQMANN